MDSGVIFQSISLLISFLTGILCGMIYDFMRILKLKLKPDRTFKNIFDIISVVIIFTFFFLFFLEFNGFNLRIYHILTVLLGLILYFGALYKLFCPVFTFFLNFTEKILIFLLYPVKFSCRIILGIFGYIFKVVKKICKWFKLLLNKPYERIKKILKRRKKV